MLKPKLLTTFLLLLLFASLLSACMADSSAPSLNDIEVELIPAKSMIPTGEFTTYTVRVSTKNKQPFDPDQVYLYLNMERMNHPTEGTMKRIDEGIYELDLPLAMAGEWYAEITLSVDEQTRTYEGFSVHAEGEMFMEYMKGYHHDHNE